MIIQFSFWDIDYISPDGRSEISDNIMTRTPSLPREKVECKNLAEAQAARAAYMARATKCGRVLTSQPYGSGRAFPGFKAFAAVSPLVNA